MSGALAHRGPDGEGIHLDGPRRARPSAAVDHRPLRRRERADDERGRLAVARLQRRDLQLPRAAAQPRGPPPLQEPGRRRGDPAPLRGEGRRRGRGARRHVRLRALGRAQAAPAARARPRGQEAALLPRRAAALRVRLRGEGAARAPGGSARARPRGAAALPDLRLRADAGDVLPRDPRAAAGAHAGGDRGGNRAAPALLARALHERLDPLPRRSGTDRRAPSRDA